MKYKFHFLLSTLALALIFSAFAVGQASASTGCFNDTNGDFAETFICWMKDNGISGGYPDGGYHPNSNVTRREMAIFLKAQADVPPAKGQILVSSGFGNWQPFASTDNLVFQYFSGSTRIAKLSTGTSFMSIHPDLTTVLYGRSLNLVGVEFCYGASSSAKLSYVEINTYTHSAGPGSRTLVFSDDTDRTDNTCRLYTLTTPVTLTAEMGVNFFVLTNWVVANTDFEIGRTTFILAPTETIAAQPAAAQTIGSGPETILSPSTNTAAP
ncbi:MAG: S-layer homology domain-containing protein [Chloroflexota bacterium]